MWRRTQTSIKSSVARIARTQRNWLLCARRECLRLQRGPRSTTSHKTSERNGNTNISTQLQHLKHLNPAANINLLSDANQWNQMETIFNIQLSGCRRFGLCENPKLQLFILMAVFFFINIQAIHTWCHRYLIASLNLPIELWLWNVMSRYLTVFAWIEW